jgi:hypothetical protein
VEWLLDANGKYVLLAPAQAVAIDISATLEDVVAVLEDLDDTIRASQSLVSDSRRWRKIRHSGLRLVSS